MLKKIALLLLLIAPMSVFAQKFGHIKSADVLTVMPEFTKAQTDIQAMQKQYEKLIFCVIYHTEISRESALRPHKGL